MGRVARRVSRPAGRMPNVFLKGLLDISIFKDFSRVGIILTDLAEIKQTLDTLHGIVSD